MWALDYRQHIIPPFQRKDVAYPDRFEQFVLRTLIGSTAEDVARRLGISAETVERIVENRLAEERRIDPQRVSTDLGLEELSLKKGHRLSVTLMTDLSDPRGGPSSWPWRGARTQPRPRSAGILSPRSNASRSGPSGWTWGRPIRRRVPRG